MTTFVDRARRARVLADRYPASREILEFYSGVATWQGEVAPSVSSFDDLGSKLESLIHLVSQIGPSALVSTAKDIDPTKFDQVARDQWESPGEFSTLEFFARTLIQVYATQLPEGLDCPWCGQNPQVGCLRTQGDGQGFDLVCALCCRRHAVMRGKCPACDESDQSLLLTYSTPDFEHLRLKACESCQGYLLVVDLEKEIQAIPEVDELAGLPLDLWAVQKGYWKLQPNLVGI